MASTHPTRLAGPFAPVVTPFHTNYSVDKSRFVSHCKWLQDNGVGLAPFGTNSEAASLSLRERIELLEGMVSAGLTVDKMMPGTGVSALPETVELTRHAVQCGVGGVLMLPPFFYKNLSDDGIFAYYSEVIEQVADPRLAIYLYHIPQMSHVPLSVTLVERLIKRYPDTVVGLKDSSGVWENSLAMIKEFSSEGFAVFPASESRMVQAVELGGAGCISATCNVNPAAIRALFDAAGKPDAARLQPAVDVIRKTFEATPMIPAMKATLARLQAHEDWRIVRPPLVAFNETQEATLIEKLVENGFQYPK